MSRRNQGNKEIYFITCKITTTCYYENIRNIKVNMMSTIERLLEKYKETKPFFVRNKIILECMGLVDIVIHKYHSSFRDKDELKNEGVFGIIRALEEFNHTKSNSFQTYAFYHIKNALQQYVYRNENTVSFVNKNDHYRMIHNNLHKYFGHRNVQQLTYSDVISFSIDIDVPVKYIETYIATQTCNLEILDYTNSHSTECDYESLEFSQKLMLAILELNKKDRDVLTSKYYNAVDTVKGTMARSSYNYIHNRAIKKLKEKLL